MNKSLLMPIVGAFALSILTGCASEAKPKPKTVESTLDEVVDMKRDENIDFHTKYHVTGVKPYSFSEGNGTSYPSGVYYLFARNSTETGYVAARVSTTGVTEHTEYGYKYSIDSVDVSAKVERELIKNGANASCTFEVNFFYVRFSNYANLAAEVISFTPPVVE